MAATYRSHQGTTYGSRTNTTITAPSGIVEGDELRMMFLLGASSAAGIPTPTWPSGWGVIGGPQTVSENNDNSSGFSVRSWLLRKRATGSEPGSYTITHSSASSDGVIVCVQSADDADGDVSARVATWSTDPVQFTDYATITYNSVTADEDGAWIGAFAHNWNLFGSASPPSGSTPTFTERQDSSGSLIYFAEGPLASAGATGAKTMGSTNPSDNSPWSSFLVCVEPAATATGAPKSFGLLLRGCG